MEKVEIKMLSYSPTGIQAAAFYEGKPIDQHYHSSEYWLMYDWGFSGPVAIDGQHKTDFHVKKLKAIIGKDILLTYKDVSREIKFNLTT